MYQENSIIKLVSHNWQLPALLSLVAAVVASIYTTTDGYSRCVAVSVYSLSLIVGLWSVFQQLRAAKAKVINFGKQHWRKDGNYLVLEIQSDFMLFRVEMKKDADTFEEVMGGTETSNDGKTTRICINAGLPDERLVGRVIVR